MDEKSRPTKKKAADQDKVVNIGDISSISGSTLNISGRDIIQGNRTIDTGGGTYIEGNVNTGGGDFVGRDKIAFSGGVDEITRMFGQVYKQIKELPNTSPEEKEDMRMVVQDVQREIGHGDRLDESILARQLRILGKMAPASLLDIILDTLVNPTTGASIAVRRIAEKIKS